jgi:hypothetical protein
LSLSNSNPQQRQEPRTNIAIEEHKKLMSPWYGPVSILRELGENKYSIIDDTNFSKTINVENLKKYYERPNWMKLEEEIIEDMNVSAATNQDQDIPPITADFIQPEQQTNNEQQPANIHQDEKQPNIRRSERTRAYIPMKGDLIDMRFKNEDDNNKLYWSCGKVIDVNNHTKSLIRIKFLDNTDEDWYDTKEEDLEIRKCIPSKTHQRCAKAKLLSIQIQELEKSEEINRKRRAEIMMSVEKKRKLQDVTDRLS